MFHYLFFRPTCVAAIWIVLVTAGAALAQSGDMRISQSDDHTVRVNARTYTARIDPAGNLHLSVDGTAALSGGMRKQVRDTKPPTSTALTERADVNVIDNRVAVSDGDKRIEYTFHSRRIDVISEGYFLFYEYADAAVAGAAPDGSGGPVTSRRGVGSIKSVILDNDKTVRFSRRFHMVERRRSFLIPSAYLRKQVQRGGRIEFTMTLGESAKAAQYLAELHLNPGQYDRQWVHENGNKGNIVHFTDPANVTLRTLQRHLGTQPFGDVTYTVRVTDHYFQGEQVAEQQQTVTMGPEQTRNLEWQLPALEPGFYYATATATQDGDTLSTAQRTFAVDLPRYSHASTRPDDFETFWDEQLAQMRRVPFDAELRKVPAKSDDTATHYDLTIAGPNGEPMHLVLEVPTGDGPFVAEFGQESDGERLTLGFAGEGRAWPDDARYRRWASADDNNMLRCLMLNMRRVDYLRSRDDVSEIYLTGASRTGPIQFITAALDPTRIQAVDIHVPTSAGISWMDHKYQGWGGKPNNMAWDKWTHMAAYVDPVNHAPDMTVPFIVAYGIDDDLSPPQGIEAMYQRAPADWKRISRDKGGHQFSKGFRELRKALASHLQQQRQADQSEAERRMLEEH